MVNCLRLINVVERGGRAEKEEQYLECGMLSVEKASLERGPLLLWTVISALHNKCNAEYQTEFSCPCTAREKS